LSFKPEDTAVGKRIRELRLAKGLTLTEVARQAGISKSLLSQVERSTANASLGVLRSIAHVLGVPFFRLFVETDFSRSLVRRKDRQKLQVPGSPIKRELLVPDLHRRMVLVVARLEPGEVSSPDVPARHEGEECVLVLAGRIEIDMDGTLIVLDEGDCLYFDAKVPHKMRNIYDGPSEVLAALAGN
jgi:transcriptional regulator with XRE-family HTH domain